MSVIGYIKGMSVDNTPRGASERHTESFSDADMRLLERDSMREDFNPDDWGGALPVYDDPGLRCECEDYPCCGH